MLKTIVLEISEYREKDDSLSFIEQSSYEMETDIEKVSDPYSAFLITDSRNCANRAKEKRIGFAVYLNSNSEALDFSDALYCVENICELSDAAVERMYLRYIGLPWTILETKRCIVREITVDDLDDLYRIYADEETSRYIEKLYENKDDEIAFTKAYIANQYRFYEYGMWVVIDKETSTLIGRAGITDREGFENTELGFIFDKSKWGQGYAYEVCSAIIDYAKDNLLIEKLNSFTMPDNKRAKALLNRLNFQYVGDKEIDSGLFCMFVR